MEDIPQYFYYERENVLLDELGDMVDNMYSIVSPNALFLLRFKKDNMFVYGTQGQLIELIYEHAYGYVYGDYGYPIDRMERIY